jgi:septum formation inhibitor MinC
MQTDFMANTRRFHQLKQWFTARAHWWQHPLAVALLLLLTVASGILAGQFPIMADLTHNHRNTLSAASKQVLEQLPGRIEVTAFCSNSPYKGRYFRKSITALIQRYQHAHPAIDLQFVDPAVDPTLARAQHIKKEGEMIIRYRGQEKRLYLPYTEEAFTNLLLQLQHGARAPILFASGHGEPGLDDHTANGASQLAVALRDAGLSIMPTTSFEQKPPAGSPLPTLVLAGATRPYTPAQVQAIRNHIQQGGNLVWLTDSASSQGLQALADSLGVIISQGMVIDPGNLQFEIPLHALSTQRYSGLGPTQEFALRTFFDAAHALQRPRQYGDTWKVLPLVAAAEHGWVSHAYRGEQYPNEQQGRSHQPAKIPAFNPQTDTQGPATVALALEKTLASGEFQRILVLGSSQFFSNGQLQRGGNLALSLQSLRWVVNNQPSVSLPTAPLRDSVVVLPSQNTWLMLLFNGFQFGLPALLLYAGWSSWRRKQQH